MREMAAEAGELLLRKGITLPKLVERDNGYARKHGMNVAQYRGERIEVNNNPALLKDIAKHGGLERIYKESVESGWSAQENVILHELGHYVDEVIRKDYKDRQVGSLFDRLNSDRVKELLSEYGASSREEFKAELISAILKGKVFPKDFLAAADLERIAKGDKFNEPNALAESLLQAGSGEVPNTTALEQQFGDMMSALFHEGGALLKVEILQNPEMEKFIDAHAQVLDNGFAFTGMSDIMRERLKESDWIFSGMKTFHELNEAFPSLLDEKGERKTFEQFLNDVQSIDSTYNRNYLNAEYNLAQASAEMAGRWEEIVQDGDDYNLQYRTAGDDKVRPEHAELNGITLPPSDSFWDTYYPPNGWNCRCTAVQVLREDYDVTPHDEAVKRAETAVGSSDNGLFKFNPGKEGSPFPPSHPYLKGPDEAREMVLKMADERKPVETFKASSIEEAEKYLEEKFCGIYGLDKAFKGKVSLKGLSLENANGVIAAVEGFFGTINAEKISGIKVIDPNSATGKKQFSSADSIACYDPISRGIYLNKDILKSAESLAEYKRKASEAFEVVKKAYEEGRLTPAQKAKAEPYIAAGRQLVDDSLQGAILHELGHHVQWSQMPADLFNSLREGMAQYSRGLSGYSTANGREYAAESFVSWMNGELRIDPRLQEWFDSIAKELPKDSGSWRQIPTERGDVRISSLHGKNEAQENIRIATYLANKYDHKISLIPNPSSCPSADSYDRTDGKFVEYKVPKGATVNAIDQNLRKAVKQANNVVMEIDSSMPLYKVADALNDRARRADNLETVRIIRDGKDAVFGRADIIKYGFKIEEADFR